MGEIGEARGQSAGVEKVPIEKLEGPEEAVLEGEPALADEGVGAALRLRKLREDSEENLVGQQEGPIGRVEDFPLV